MIECPDCRFPFSEDDHVCDEEAWDYTGGYSRADLLFGGNWS